ncbi:hypothetical protein TNCV_5113601 [Trichonephila clavipes]|nr:hypothetical protein TNCV_5113601 [Trichonephila clavipes]
MAAVDFLHHEKPPTWAGVEPDTLGAEGQQQTNYAIHSAYKYIALQQRCESELYSDGKLPLNAVHKWQYYRLNYQTDIQICSQYVWDNNESAPAFIGNCFPDPGSRWRFSESRSQTVCLQEFPGLLLTNTWQSLAPRQNLLSSRKISTPSSNDTTSIANDSVLELVEYTQQGTWLGAVLEVTVFKQFVVSLRYQQQLEFLPQMRYSCTLNTAVFTLNGATWSPGKRSS